MGSDDGFLAELAGLDDLRIEPVAVPEWGRTVHVRLMSISRREAWERWLTEHGRDGYYYAGLVAYAACTPDGEPLFPEPDRAVEVLARRAWTPVKRLAEAAMRINRLTQEAEEDAAKN